MTNPKSSPESAVPEPRSNTWLWDKVKCPDPSFTKSFKRSGGFAGTSVKPILAVQQMTEIFGLCGIGWGMDEPKYSFADGAGTEKLVFCSVRVWYLLDGVRGEIWGQGGDKIVVTESRGDRSNDEAYKMAYTDALGNAFKSLGFAADIHAGIYEQTKYDRTTEPEPEPEPMSPEREAAMAKIAEFKKQGHLDTLKALSLQLFKVARAGDLTDKQLQALVVAMPTRIKELAAQSSADEPPWP